MTARIPTPVPGVDVMALPLSTQEGFVLSRVDGSCSVEDISMMSGVSVDDLLPILGRLAQLGAVELGWDGAPVPKAPPPAMPTAHYDPGELDEQVEIPPEVRKRILDAFYAMEGCTHYEVLTVYEDAPKAAVRESYFAAAKVFHPDAFFGKELGSYRTKMEAVFKRFTEAYETLSRTKKRREYDEYLAATQTTRHARQALGSTPPQPRASVEPVQSAAKVEVADTPADQPSGEPSQRKPRERLATGNVEVDMLLDEANKAVEGGDHLGAATALQQAMGMAPEHQEIHDEYGRVRGVLDRELAGNYEKQARYEEKQGDWRRAAQNWCKVADARPDDAEAARAAARSLLKASDDMHLAQKYAVLAAELEPENLRSLTVLARVYLAAGLRVSARRQLQKAAKLAPDDPVVKDLLEEAG